MRINVILPALGKVTAKSKDFHVLFPEQHSSPSVSGAQLQSSVERPCPGESVTFTCTIPSLGHQWDIPFHSMSQRVAARDQGGIISAPPFQFNVTEVTASNIRSTATVNATADLNGTLVSCQDSILGMLPIQNSTINIIGEYCDVYAYK